MRNTKKEINEYVSKLIKTLADLDDIVTKTKEIIKTYSETCSDNASTPNLKKLNKKTEEINKQIKKIDHKLKKLGLHTTEKMMALSKQITEFAADAMLPDDDVIKTIIEIVPTLETLDNDLKILNDARYQEYRGPNDLLNKWYVKRISRWPLLNIKGRKKVKQYLKTPDIIIKYGEMVDNMPNVPLIDWQGYNSLIIKKSQVLFNKIIKTKDKDEKTENPLNRLKTNPLKLSFALGYITNELESKRSKKIVRRILIIGAVVLGAVLNYSIPSPKQAPQSYQPKDKQVTEVIDNIKQKKQMFTQHNASKHVQPTTKSLQDSSSNTKDSKTKNKLYKIRKSKF